MRDEIRARTGERLLVRPIRETDAGALVALHSRLSKDTIYRRYFGARPHLSPADVDRFTRLPEHWRFALVAVREPAELVAVARYEGTPGGTAAEVAIVVDDAHQHLGVGRALFGRLAEVAHRSGLSTLVAEVLPDNEPMLRLLRGTGWLCRVEHEPGVRRCTIDLSALVLTGDGAARAEAHRAAAHGPPRPM